MTTDSVSSREQALAAPQFFPSLRRRLVETLREWRRRVRSRSELAALSDLELRDLGYPAEIEAEKHKPFWRA